MATSSRLTRAIGVAVVTVVVLLCAACSSGSPSSQKDGVPKATAVATGTVGAAHLDDGYLSVGTGSTRVDTYIDPMCPYCREFETANGRQLAQLVNAGTITLNVHPLNFLDPSSQGTAYSSRASNALTCVAAASPTKTLSYLGSLYAHQPEEGTPGLSDKQLVSLATDIGSTSITQCVASQRYVPWVTKITRAALKGPIPGANIAAVTGTPTILVNGDAFTGDFSNAAAVKEFVLSGGK